MNRKQLRSAGFTMVELMVAMVIGLFIALALITMLINVSRNNTELTNTNRLVENGRFAAQIVASDLLHTGYWGGYIPNFDDLKFSGVPTLSSIVGGSAPTAIPDPCAAFSTWTDEYKANFIAIPVAASNVSSTGTPPFCSTLVTSPKASSDVLVVRHAETCVAGSGTNECADTTGAAFPDLYFQASKCDTDTLTYVLGTTGFGLKKRSGTTECGATADVRRVTSALYYVKDNGSSGMPALMRSTMAAGGADPAHQAAQPLVDGVEYFRVEFGIDSVSDSGAAVTATQAINWASTTVQNSPTNRGDGIPDGAYVHCTQAAPCTTFQMMNAVSARIYILVRAENATANYTDGRTYAMGSTSVGPFNDHYKRHLFVQTVRFHNVSGRRETP